MRALLANENCGMARERWEQYLRECAALDKSRWASRHPDDYCTKCGVMKQVVVRTLGFP